MTIMAEATVRHEPVLLREALAALAVEPGGRYVDCTVDGGGHAEAILEAAAPGGALVGIDADPETLALAAARLSRFGAAFVAVQGNFRDLDTICRERDFAPVNGILFDLGLSSRQLDAEDRGFSFRREGRLDMRFAGKGDPTAERIVNEWAEEELANLIYGYGEEPRSRRIARAIVAARPIDDAKQLADVVARSAGYPRGRTHPATRTFQALRIAVNHEIEALKAGLRQATHVLDEGGRLVTISYHSLEDREIKRFVNGSDDIVPLSKKVIRPSREEVQRNPRSRSAKLRVAERRSTRAGAVGSPLSPSNGA